MRVKKYFEVLKHLIKDMKIPEKFEYIKEMTNGLKIKDKLVLYSSVLVIILVTILFFSGYAIISSILYNLNAQIIASEVKTTSKIAEDSYKLLDSQGLSKMNNYIEKAKETVINEFKSYKFKETGRLTLISSKDSSIIFDKNIATLPNKKFNDIANLKANDGVYKYSISDKYYLAYYKKLDVYDWTILISIEDKEIKAPQKQYINQVLIISLILLTGFIVFFFKFGKSISEPIIDVSNVLALVSNGDLTVKIEGANIHRKDEIGNLLRSTKLMIENIRKLISKATLISGNLGEVATNQASAIEETSATMEEISSMINNTAKNILETDELMTDVKSNVEITSDYINNLSLSMKNISVSSTEIAKITKTIDEIAFQTNMLSLNAAVEAARAGEAGAGFGVVAGEVKNLSERSSKAAKDISEIISNTLLKINDSEKIANETNKIFLTVFEKSNSVRDLVSQITKATSEQNIGISEISKAIILIEDGAQRNVDNSQNLLKNITKFKV